MEPSGPARKGVAIPFTVGSPLTVLLVMFIAAVFALTSAPLAHAQEEETTHIGPAYYQAFSSGCMFGFGGCSQAAQGGSANCVYNSPAASFGPIVFDEPTGASPDKGLYPPMTSGCVETSELGHQTQDLNGSVTVGGVKWTMSGSAEQAATSEGDVSAMASIWETGPNNGAFVNSFVVYYQSDLYAPGPQGTEFTLQFAVDGHLTQTRGISGSSSGTVCIWTDAPDFECAFSPPPLSGGSARILSTPPTRIGPSGRYTITVYAQATITGDTGDYSYVNVELFSPDSVNPPANLKLTLPPTEWGSDTFAGAQSVTMRAIEPGPAPVFPGRIGHGLPTLTDAKHPAVGFYVNPAGATEGFEDFNFGNGNITSIVAPNDNVGFTRALGINSSGTIVGDYEQNYGPGIFRFRGFLLKDGVFTTYDEGDTVSSDIYNINDNGDFVGSFSNFAIPLTGFLQRANGTLSTFSFPGAAATVPAAVNNSGAIVGYYTDSQNHNHGFLRNPDGTMAPFDFPGAVSTVPNSITNAGTINGYFTDSFGAAHGFFGTFGFFLQYDLQSGTNAAPRILNDAGVVAGAFAVSPSLQEGFAAQLCAANVSADVTITGGPFVTDATGEVVQNVTLTNTTEEPIAGPLRLLFENLAPGVFMDNGNLASICTQPGAPYVLINLVNLPPGHSTTSTVHFVNGSGGSTISYNPVLLAGDQVP